MSGGGYSGYPQRSTCGNTDNPLETLHWIEPRPSEQGPVEELDMGRGSVRHPTVQSHTKYLDTAGLNSI